VEAHKGFRESECGAGIMHRFVVCSSFAPSMTLATTLSEHPIAPAHVVRSRNKVEVRDRFMERKVQLASDSIECLHPCLETVSSMISS
jgi:hypothetical protein